MRTGVLVEKPEGKTTWNTEAFDEDNIKIDLQEVGLL